MVKSALDLATATLPCKLNVKIRLVSSILIFSPAATTPLLAPSQMRLVVAAMSTVLPCNTSAT